MKPTTQPAHPEAGVSTTLAADEIGCTARQVRHLLERGESDGYKVGPRTWRTTLAAIRKFQAAGGTGGAK